MPASAPTLRIAFADLIERLYLIFVAHGTAPEVARVLRKTVPVPSVTAPIATVLSGFQVIFRPSPAAGSMARRCLWWRM